jgi:glycosyltransferase involved in cell wall biosynthesis
MRLHIDGRMLYMSGIGRCLREILNELVKDDGIKVSLSGSYNDYSKYIDEYDIDKEIITFREYNSPIYSVSEQVIGSLRSLKLRNNIDIFYYPHYNLPYLIPGNSIITIHDFIQFKFPEYFGKNKVRIAWLILNNAVKKAAKIIVDSCSTEKDLNDYFPDCRGKTEVIYNGISTNFRTVDIEEKKDFIGRNNPGKYILFVGNNKPHKNINGLIGAFLEIKKEYGDFKLVIISSGFKLEDIPVSDNIRRDIIIISGVSEEELIMYYNCAHMLVLPSFYEGFGLPVIEAMACGCPVVASDTSSMPELGGDAAIYVNPNNESSIADGMIKLIKDDNLRGSLVGKGFERAAAFTWTKTAERYIGVFRNMVY